MRSSTACKTTSALLAITVALWIILITKKHDRQTDEALVCASVVTAILSIITYICGKDDEYGLGKQLIPQQKDGDPAPVQQAQVTGHAWAAVVVPRENSSVHVQNPPPAKPQPA